MIKGKLQGNINIYSFHRKAQYEAPNYSIFNFKMPLGMSQSNLKRLSIGEDDEEVGVILGNKKMIDIKNTTIGFKGKKAMSVKFARNMIIKMIFPNKKDLRYTDWLKLSENYIYKIKPTYVMFPINKEFNIKIENAKLKNKLEVLEKENERIPKAKALLEEYNSALKQKETEIKRLKEKNQKLNNYIKKIPKILRNIFTKEDDIKILIDEE